MKLMVFDDCLTVCCGINVGFCRQMRGSQVKGMLVIFLAGVNVMG